MVKLLVRAKYCVNESQIRVFLKKELVSQVTLDLLNYNGITEYFL